MCFFRNIRKIFIEFVMIEFKEVVIIQIQGGPGAPFNERCVQIHSNATKYGPEGTFIRIYVLLLARHSKIPKILKKNKKL